MSHKFKCSRCGKVVADCGMEHGHEEVFKFQTSCCNKDISGGCGGKKDSTKTDSTESDT